VEASRLVTEIEGRQAGDPHGTTAAYRHLVKVSSVVGNVVVCDGVREGGGSFDSHHFVYHLLACLDL
jgi:hypothetical protein